MVSGETLANEDMQPTETARPNGAIYRRRKPLRAEFITWNGDSVAVLVYGTHERAQADGLAAVVWADEADGEMPEPVARWIKSVPWDALGLGYDRTTLEVPGNTRGSTPVLRYGGEYHWDDLSHRPGDRP